MPNLSRRVDLATVSRRRVLDARGEPLGRIQALYIDMSEGRVEYATLRLHTTPEGMDRNLVIPWSQFGIAADGEHLELDISRKVLETVATGSSRGPGGSP